MSAAAGRRGPWTFVAAVRPQDLGPYEVPPMWRCADDGACHRLTGDGWVEDDDPPRGLVVWQRHDVDVVLEGLVGTRTVAPHARPDAPTRSSGDGKDAAPARSSSTLMWRIFWIAMLIVAAVLVVREVT